MDNILDVKDLSVQFSTHAGVLTAVRDASFFVKSGEVLAIVGESGSGKSVLTQSLVRLMPDPPCQIAGGEAWFEGKDLTKLTETELEGIRGKKISVIFQDAMTALNPTMKIGKQITEVILEHMNFNGKERSSFAEELVQAFAISGHKAIDKWLMEHFRMEQDRIDQVRNKIIDMLGSQDAKPKVVEWIKKEGNITRQQAYDIAVSLLKLVKIPEAERRMGQYIFQFSGGMRQRVMIAMALACRPNLLIADEPTTALDVTIKSEVLELLISLIRELQTSIILITHDLGIVASYADRIHVMYAGSFVEKGLAKDIFYNPQHPYTKGLLAAIPRLDLNAQEKLKNIEGVPPNMLDTHKGCPFAPRCEYCMEVCLQVPPPETVLSETQSASCWILDPRAENARKAFHI